ncbi:MAG: hypothetical protein RL625_1614 [Gemmatimonadota bacterium]|jgi:outer membrane protein insertion porin family/translocation and assembly module TamA
MRLALGLATVMGLLLAAQVAGAQETRCERGDTEVREVRFSGNTAFTDDELILGIVTTPSSWLRRTTRYFGVKHCLAVREFPRDVERLRVFYRNHGFVEVQVDTVVTRVTDGVVTIRFDITEGEPILVDQVIVEGLEEVPEALAVQRALPAAIGEPFDRYANRATLDTIARRLRNTGYPEAEAFLGYDIRFLERRATVRFAVAPGPRRRLGEIRILRAGPNGSAPEISTGAVRNLAGLSTGELYQERQLERAKRLLYQSEAFASVEVRPLLAGADSVLPVEIEVTEAALGNARFGTGMANLDCVRTTAELTRHNIFQTASRLELRARVSKIGADQLCPGLTSRDPYSQTLNYYVSTTITQPFIFRTRFVPTYTLYQERRGEYRAFLREAPIGVSASFSRAQAARALNLGYSIELGRTEAQPALFCAVFNACVAADRESLQRFQRLAVVSAATSFAQTDDAVDPSRGVVARADIRYASKFVGSDKALEFARFSLDGSVYRRISDDIVLAMRLRVGGVVGPTFAIDAKERFVPAQERLLAGGPTTVRGFRQNELGPAVYIPEAYDTLTATGAPVTGFEVGDTVFFQAADSGGRRAVPTGGNAMVVGNVELRFDSPLFPELLSLVAFADAGRVWNRGVGVERLRFTSLAVTPGFGVRVRTPVGQIRADIGYNQYRPTAGAAYFDAPLTEGGALYCVSPGNTLAVTKVVEDGIARVVQAGGACPGTYQPRRAENFLSRLTFAFAIGQAF